MAKGQDRSAKDKEMSSMLKKTGQAERTIAKCPICYATVKNNGFAMYGHMVSHAGIEGSTRYQRRMTK